MYHERTWAFILRGTMNHVKGSDFVKVSQGFAAVVVVYLLSHVYCVVKDYGLMGVRAGGRMKRRRPDGIYCHSPQPKKPCWLGADGRRKCTGGHNLSKEWKGFGFTKEFNV